VYSNKIIGQFILSTKTLVFLLNPNPFITRLTPPPVPLLFGVNDEIINGYVNVFTTEFILAAPFKLLITDIGQVPTGPFPFIFY
jgi:hypothetical protein